MGESQGAVTDPFWYKPAANGARAERTVAIESLEIFILGCVDQIEAIQTTSRNQRPRGVFIQCLCGRSVMHGAQRNLVISRKRHCRGANVGGWGRPMTKFPRAELWNARRRSPKGPRTLVKYGRGVVRVLCAACRLVWGVNSPQNGVGSCRLGPSVMSFSCLGAMCDLVSTTSITRRRFFSRRIFHRQPRLVNSRADLLHYTIITCAPGVLLGISTCID
jgi:hypothetical protein